MKRIAFLFGVCVAVAIGFGTFAAWLASEGKAALAESVTLNRSAPRKVDLNTATMRELERLPGIGPELATRVMRYRPYRKLDELISRKVLGRKQFARIKERVFINLVPQRSTEQ